MPENGSVNGGAGRDAPDRPDRNDRGGAREKKEAKAAKADSFDRAMDNANRPDRASAAQPETTKVADDGDDDNTTNKSGDRQDRAAGPPGIGAPPSSSSPADTLTALTTDVEDNARSTSPVADRINNTKNYSVDNLRDVFTPEQSQALVDGAGVMEGALVSEEFCTIEVRSKTISGVGAVEYGPYSIGPFEVGPVEQPAHAYVVTTDSVPRPDAYLGSETIHRGGPESRTQTPGDGSVWGDIKTVSSVDFRSPDYTTEERPSVTVGVFEGNCDPYDRAIGEAGNEIEAERHDYSPTGPNSNTAVTEMLDRSGLPAPEDYPGWTPGSDMDLPDDKPPTNPDRSNDWVWDRAW